MELDQNKIINKYKIYPSQLDSITDIINIYLNQISTENLENKTNAELIGILGVLSEALPIVVNKKAALTKIQHLVDILLLKIKNGDIVSLSLHEGISNIGIYIFYIHTQTSLFEKELNWINELLYKYLNWYFNNFEKSLPVKTAIFDVITGLSGIGNYLLLFSDVPKITAILEKICRYLVNIVVLPENDTTMPPWKIDLKDEPLSEYYSLYEEGYINYTVSHGIGGILLFLLHSSKKGIQIDNQQKAIELIIKEYFTIHKVSNGIWWSGIISQKNYKRNYFPKIIQRQSWCSGNITVLYALYKSSQLIKDRNIEKTIVQEIRELANLSLDAYGLYSPIICHGYAGLLTIIRSIYNDTNQIQLYRKMIELLSVIINSYDSKNKYGFINIAFPNSKIDVITDDNTFLNGAAGIIMELLSYLKQNSFFEKLLLLK